MTRAMWMVLAASCLAWGAAETRTLYGADQEGDAPVAPLPSGGKGGAVGTQPDERLTVAGIERAYRLVVPQSIDPAEPAPLVFAFHGLGDSKDIMSLYTQLHRVAEQRKFVLVFPDGKGRAWPFLIKTARDDLAFFDALYEHVTSQYNIDLNRVYLTGMSNGAYFSHLLASQRSDKIAAIAPHSGGLGLFDRVPIQVANKYAVLVVHGERDAIVNVNEGRKTRDAYQRWGHPVEYLEVEGLNHFWAHSADVNRRMADFFAAHPRVLPKP